MAFFGLTRQGDYNELLHSQPVSVEEPAFAAVADQQFEQAFAQHVLGDTPRAAALQVNGSSTILRKELLNILPAVLGRSPCKAEFNVFFTCAPNHLCHSMCGVLTRASCCVPLSEGWCPKQA